MIDLRSDTVTKPDDAMREAAAAADVGDDVYGEDPTVNELERRAAEFAGKDAALFVPTGTMGNQIAAHVHAEPGEEVLVEAKSHVLNAEQSGLARHSRLQTQPIDAAPRGVIEPEQVRARYREGDMHRPATGLLCLENTHNMHGGTAIAPERIDEAAAAAHELGIPVHLDGARIANAAVALDVPVARIASEVDSVMFCLSKGLGAPVGSVLAGDEAFVAAARRVRKFMGGGMRQAGVIAAPGLRALDNVDRLAEDHANAARLATGLADVDGLGVNDPETNIVLVDTSGADLDASAALERFEEAGVLGTPFGDAVVRFCTHWDVDRSDVDDAIDRAEDAI